MIVLDASVVAKAYLPEVGSDEAAALLTSKERLLAPELIGVEVSAAICRRVRHGELTPDEASKRCEHWLESLQHGLIQLTPDMDLLRDAIALSTSVHHALHDCLYLAAARRFDTPLITADRVFRDRFHAFDARVTLLAGCEAS